MEASGCFSSYKRCIVRDFHEIVIKLVDKH
jgi:hypothetical protein